MYTGKVEVGQNVRTELTQVVAEELRLPPGADRPGHGRHRLHSVRRRHRRQPPEHAGHGRAPAPSGCGGARGAARPAAGEGKVSCESPSSWPTAR
ncbi:MAG: hypothetical protein U0736_27880 [Gemmataceae bacterium]